VPEARGQPVEQPVERGSELRQFVVRLAQREPVVEIALAPRRGLPGHAAHGRE